MRNQGRFISHIRHGKTVVKEERSVNGLTNLEKPFQAVAALPQDTPLDLAYSVDLTSTPPAPQITLYSIGGVRLKLTYNLNSLTHEDKNRLDSITWTFNQAGRLCKDLKVYANNKTPDGKTQCEDMTSTTDGPVFTAEHSTQGDKETDHTLYWEPQEWSNTLNTTLTTTTHYKAGKDTITGYANGQAVTVDYPKITQTLAIKTRELGPQAAGQEHRGNDVKMLEQMLWQLGISPQRATNTNNPNAGSMGARIDSLRGGYEKETVKDENGKDITQDKLDKDGNKIPRRTEACVAAQPQQRDVFLNLAAKAGCVSHELMLRRFQARNNTSTLHGNKVNTELLNAAEGSVDNKTLESIKRDWELYSMAYAEFEENSKISPATLPTNMVEWVDEAVKIWTDGQGDWVPEKTYTKEIHDAILELAGVTPTVSNNRQAFLKKWITKESSHHWGGNFNGYQETPFRMEEGGADEHGSLSFSQLLYGHRFGQNPCAAHADIGLNIYHPKDQVKTFVVHTASKGGAGANQSGCKGLMYRGFNKNDSTLAKTFTSDTGMMDNKAANVSDLRGYRHGSGSITAMSTVEDNYDVLAKAIVGYNGGEGFAAGHGWAKFLKYKLYDKKSNRNAGGICHSCRYSIEVRESLFGQNLRTYIWKGGTYAADLKDEQGNPDSRAGQDWCFGYGEQEWLNPAKHPVTGKAMVWKDYKDVANSNLDKRVDCE